MLNTIKELYCNEIIEELYTPNHPEVIKLANYFHQIIQKKKIFESFNEKLPRGLLTARIVATAWHAFSDFMPEFLCHAATLMSNNLARHFVIQIAFDELGMRNHKLIHPQLFWEAAKSVGITAEYSVISQSEGVKGSLDFLRNHLASCYSDIQIFGILLGLEIPAIENIETIFSSMSYNQSSAEILEKEMFFILHREVEIEHISFAISNFLRFKRSKKDIDPFIDGFDHGVIFWEMFWRAVKNQVVNFH